MKVKKEIRAIYIKIITLGWEKRTRCELRRCDCTGVSFTLEDEFYAQRFERKYGNE